MGGREESFHLEEEGAVVGWCDEMDKMLPVPVAQLVECWTPCGESTRPDYESPRVRGATGARYL